jgi:hypothetical protein
MNGPFESGLQPIGTDKNYFQITYPGGKSTHRIEFQTRGSRRTFGSGIGELGPINAPFQGNVLNDIKTRPYIKINI